MPNMSSRKLLTIFGSTGNQGGSIIDVILAHPELKEKYALRGVTRDPASGKSKKLSDQGVELVKGDTDDVESLKEAVRGSYGVFAATDYWSHADMQREIRQGKNIFEACKAEGIKHLVFSSLENVEKMTDGRLKNVEHFDSKATVADYIEENKGDMIASYYQPAMFFSYLSSLKVIDGAPTLAIPFADENVASPLLEPRRDGGKWVVPLFEGEQKANGVKVHGVSDWTTPKKAVEALSKSTGQDVVFKAVPFEAFRNIMVAAAGEHVGNELAEMMVFIGEYSYYGQGEDKKQGEHNKWLLEGSELIGVGQWAREYGPKKFE